MNKTVYFALAFLDICPEENMNRQIDAFCLNKNAQFHNWLNLTSNRMPIKHKAKKPKTICPKELMPPMRWNNGHFVLEHTSQPD